MGLPSASPHPCPGHLGRSGPTTATPPTVTHPTTHCRCPLARPLSCPAHQGSRARAPAPLCLPLPALAASPPAREPSPDPRSPLGTCFAKALPAEPVLAQLAQRVKPRTQWLGWRHTGSAGRSASSSGHFSSAPNSLEAGEPAPSSSTSTCPLPLSNPPLHFFPGPSLPSAYRHVLCPHFPGVLPSLTWFRAS